MIGGEQTLSFLKHTMKNGMTKTQNELENSIKMTRARERDSLKMAFFVVFVEIYNE